MCVCAPRTGQGSAENREHEREKNMEITDAVNCHVDTRNRTHNLWKNKCFQPLIDLSSPTVNILSINSGFSIINGLSKYFLNTFSCIPLREITQGFLMTSLCLLQQTVSSLLACEPIIRSCLIFQVGLGFFHNATLHTPLHSESPRPWWIITPPGSHVLVS